MRILILILVLLTDFSFSSNKIKVEDGWLGILPIKSDRKIVEEKLANSKPSNYQSYTVYNLDDATITVDYTVEPCSSKPFGEWNVPKNTVLEYSVAVKKMVLISELDFTADGYRKIDKSEIDGTINYINTEKGISIYTYKESKTSDEILTTIFYRPGENNAHLKCKIE